MGCGSSVELRARRRVPRGGAGDAGGAPVPVPPVGEEVTTAGLETPPKNDTNPIEEDAPQASQQHEEEEVVEEEVEVPIRVQRLRVRRVPTVPLSVSRVFFPVDQFSTISVLSCT